MIPSFALQTSHASHYMHNKFTSMAHLKAPLLLCLLYHTKMGTDQEVRTMVANLTNRLNELQSKPHFGRKFHRRDNEDDEQGQNIVNLTGSNSGAVMKAKLEEGTKTIGDGGEDEMKGTYVNSNFQAVNNSILLGGSYTSEDPGVHMVVKDYQMEHAGYVLMEEKKKKIKKEKEGGKKADEHHQEYERAAKNQLD